MDSLKVVANVPQPNRPSDKWEVGSVKKIDAYLYKLTDVKLINNETEEPIKLKGKYFLAEYNPLYWHFLHEDLAGYEGIKQLYSDLQLVLFDSQHIMVDATTLAEHRKHFPYIEYFAKMYGVKELFDLSKNWEFEEVYYTPTSSQVLIEDYIWGENKPMSIWPSEDYDKWDAAPWTERSPFAVAGLNEITQKLYNNIALDLSLPKKIFISRRDVNARLEELEGKEGYEHLVEERLFDGEFLEKYFEQKGYEIIALEEHSYEKQMQLFMNASHIAGTVGAGFANLHMSQPHTKLIELHVIPIYGFDYGYFSSFRDIDYIPVELRNLEEKRALSQQEMLEVLDELEI